MLLSRDELKLLEVISKDTLRNEVSSRKSIIERSGIARPEKALSALLHQGHIKMTSDGGWYAIKCVSGLPLAAPTCVLDSSQDPLSVPPPGAPTRPKR